MHPILVADPASALATTFSTATKPAATLAAATLAAATLAAATLAAATLLPRPQPSRSPPALIFAHPPPTLGPPLTPNPAPIPEQVRRVPG